jgi:hypothetical protein
VRAEALRSLICHEAFMKFGIPTMHGIIERRMLVNFRVRTEAVRPLLPTFFRPKLVNEWAIAGICLIRLKDLRPRGLPAICGLSSENAAHRIAVEWDETGQTREGVYVPRRDTSSIFQAFAGGRVFPGVHHPAEFKVHEQNDAIRLEMNSRDGTAAVNVHARPASALPATSVFASLADASDFFARGSSGYSATENPACCDGLELHTAHWKVEPLAVDFVKSSFFDDKSRFPDGAAHFDCALMMRNIPHQWNVLKCMERQL